MGTKHCSGLEWGWFFALCSSLIVTPVLESPSSWLPFADPQFFSHNSNLPILMPVLILPLLLAMLSLLLLVLLLPSLFLWLPSPQPYPTHLPLLPLYSFLTPAASAYPHPSVVLDDLPQVSPLSPQNKYCHCYSIDGSLQNKYCHCYSIGGCSASKVIYNDEPSDLI